MLALLAEEVEYVAEAKNAVAPTHSHPVMHRDARGRANKEAMLICDFIDASAQRDLDAHGKYYDASRGR